MRSLVTGATGFIGSHVAEILKSRGHTVRLLVRNEKRLFPELREGYDIVKGDVTQTVDELRKAVEGVDYIFHVAGLIKGRTQRDFNNVNAYGTQRLMQAVEVSGNDTMRFVLVSSLAAIGPSEPEPGSACDPCTRRSRAGDDGCQSIIAGGFGTDQ